MRENEVCELQPQGLGTKSMSDELEMIPSPKTRAAGTRVIEVRE